MEAALEVVMRVPGLFFIDYWWQHDRNKSLSSSMEVEEIVNCVITNCVLLYGFLLLLLPLRHVRALYTNFVWAAIIVSCHVVSGHYVEMEISKKDMDDPHFLRRQIAMLILYGVLGELTNVLKEPRITASPNFSVYIIPVIARLSNLPLETLPYIQNFCTAVTGFLVFLHVIYQIPNIVGYSKLAYMNALFHPEACGNETLFRLLWKRLFDPSQLALFWLINFFVKLVGSMYLMDKLPWYIIILATVCSICNNPLTLVATSVTVLNVSHFILSSTRAYLQGLSTFLHNNNLMHSGCKEDLILALYCVQIGLMKMSIRMAVIIVIFTVLPSLLQSMIETAEHVLLFTTPSRKRSIWRNLRAHSLKHIFFFIALCLSDALLVVVKYTVNNKEQLAGFLLSFWMIITLFSCILTILRVYFILFVHDLFPFYSERSSTTRDFNNILYYMRAIKKFLKSFISIFVAIVGLQELTLGKFNWFNASVLLVHCYSNIWLRLQSGGFASLVKIGKLLNCL